MSNPERKVLCRMLCTNEDAKQKVDIREGQNIIGRNFKDCNVVLGYLSISQRHCKLIIKGKQGFITDLGSKNGVFLNEMRIPANQELEFNLDKDRLQISEVHCQFDFQQEEPQSSRSKSLKPILSMEANKKVNEDETKKVVKISKPNNTFKEDIVEEEVTDSHSNKKEPPKKGRPLHRYLDSDSSDQTKDEVKEQSLEKTARDAKGKKKQGKKQQKSKEKKPKKEAKLAPLTERESDGSDPESGKKPKKQKNVKQSAQLEKPAASSHPKTTKPLHKSKQQKLQTEELKQPKSDSPARSSKNVSKDSGVLKLPRGTRFVIIASGVDEIVSPLTLIEVSPTIKSNYRICVMKEYIRTFKLLFSIASGKHIVSMKWLEQCEKTHQVVDYMDYLLEAPTNPGLLRKSVEKAQKNPNGIFQGMEFCLTKADFHLHRRDIFDLIDACGGNNVSQRSLEYPKEKLIILVPHEVPSENSLVRTQIKEFIAKGYHVQTIEMVLNSCLHQTLLLEPSYKLE